MGTAAGFDSSGYEKHNLDYYSRELGVSKSEVICQMVAINVEASEVAPSAPVPFIVMDDSVFIAKSFATALRKIATD